MTANASQSASPSLLSRIVSFHAHIYYDPARTRDAAEQLREQIGQRFSVQLGRWHDVLVGPHSAAMYQVAFDVALFDRFVPWLMLNRRDLDVLVHPNTLAPRADHLVHALWLGTPRLLHGDRLAERIAPEDESAIVPNTAPTLAP